MIDTPSHSHLRIWQQNARKSNDAQLTTLHTVNNQADIICIQEPHFDFQQISRSTGVWYTVYPTPWPAALEQYKKRSTGNSTRRPPGTHSGTDEEQRPPVPRTMILIHQRIRTDQWEQIPVDSLDIVAIKFKSPAGHISIYNIYNACEHSHTILKLRQHLHQRETDSDKSDQDEDDNANDIDNRDPTTGDIWLGDFNRHHPLWDRPEDTRLFTRTNLDAAEILLNLLADYGMEMALPPGVPTIRNSAGNETRPDNVFCSDTLTDLIEHCTVIPEDSPATSDHYPIFTKIALPTASSTPVPPRDFRDVDWEDFRRHIELELAKIPDPSPLYNADDVESALDHLEAAIIATIEALVPRKRPTPYSKRWWTRELTLARQHHRRTTAKARVYWNAPQHTIHEEARRARNDYTNLLKTTRREHWEEWIANISSLNIWDANKFIGRPPSDGGKTRVPTLRTKTAQGDTLEHTTNAAKSKVLHSTFFYEPPAPKNLAETTRYPGPKFKMEAISDDLIIKTAQKLKPYKAPGMNEIPNVVLTKCIHQIAPYLGHIFRATFTGAKHYPTRWKHYTTAVLKKPGRADYSDPNAYRPIALLDTMAKLLSACVKEVLEYHVSKHNMLPKRQFGGQPGRTTTDSIHLLIDFIKRAWRQKQETVVVFLDIKAAFPNTGVEMLIHELRKQGIPKVLAAWVARKMDGRETTLKFDDYMSEPIPVSSGLDQGCNLSVLLFSFYSSAQLSRKPLRRDELIGGFVDDTFTAVMAPTVQGAIEKAEATLTREHGLLEWAQTHDCIYSYAKFCALHPTRTRIPDPNNPRRNIKPPPLSIKITDNHIIQTTATCKFLGVIIDSELRFKEQAQAAIAKGAQWAGQIRRLSKMATGARGDVIGRLYKAVAIPKMLYAADVWCVPYLRARKGTADRKNMVATIRKMDSIQRRVAIQMTGALRTTPTDVLLAHANLLPMREAITLQCQAAALRLATLPDHHPTHRAIHLARQRPSFRHSTPLDNLMALAKLQKKNIEIIETKKRHPCWTAPFHISIPTSAEEAEALDANDESDVRIYTDGSGHDDNIGAAAVLYRGIHRPRVARHHLGSTAHHTVFAGEAVGQLLAMHLLTTATGSLAHNKILIAVDNQASLLRHRATKPATRDDIYAEIYQAATHLKTRHTGIEITMRWIPSHTGTGTRNDDADAEAKRAATSADDDKNNNFGILKKTLPVTKAAWKQELRTQVVEKYKRDFRALPRYPTAALVDASVPSNKYRRLTRDLTRRQTSLLTQLRTGHIALNAYLHRFKLADSPLCPECKQEPESVLHVLKYCTAYAEQRHCLQQNLGHDIEIDRSLLSDPKRVRHILEYLDATSRFRDTHGSLLNEAHDTEEQLDGATERRRQNETDNNDDDDEERPWI